VLEANNDESSKVGFVRALGRGGTYGRRGGTLDTLGAKSEFKIKWKLK
jgi:hypothetical protein